MALLEDERQDITDPHKNADDLSSALFSMLLQMTKGPPQTATRAAYDDRGFDTLRLLRYHSGKKSGKTNAADEDVGVSEGRTAQH